MRVGGFGPDVWRALLDQPVVFFKHRQGCEKVFRFGPFVVGILLWCSCVEMGGLDAAAPIAHVQDLRVWGNRSSTDFVRGPVRQDLATVL